MPRRRNARCSALDDASSSSGSSCGSISTMVTSAPNDRQIEANSTPITPPPRMIADDGTWSSTSASSELITREPSRLRPGRLFGTDPVASTICGAVYTSSPTRTLVADSRRPAPMTVSILRLAIVDCRPLNSRSTTEFL
jgi:hypothetical protein